MARKYDGRSLKRSNKRLKHWSNQHRSNYIASARDLRILEGMLCGMTMTAAAIAAGYSRSYASTNAGKLYERAQRLMPFSMVETKYLSDKAKEQLKRILDRDEIAPKDVLPACRMAFELSGELGQAAHTGDGSLPEVVKQLVIEKTAEIQARRLQIMGTIDGTVVSENAASQS